MHLPDQWEVVLAVRDWLDRVVQRFDAGSCAGCAAFTERDDGDGCLALTVDAEQVVDRGIVEAEDDLRLQLFGRCDSQDVAERRPEIPVGVAVGAFFVAPGVAPEGARCDHHHRRFCDRRLCASSFDDRSTKIPRTNLPEAMGVGGVVVDASIETVEVAADVVELQVVASAGAASRAIEDLAPGAVAAAFEDAVREQADPSQCRRERASRQACFGSRHRDRFEQRHCERIEFVRQVDPIEVRVDLEGVRFVVRALLAQRRLEVRGDAHHRFGLPVIALD